MLNSDQLQTLHAFVAVYSEFPKYSVRKFHSRFSHYKNRQTTQNLISEAIEQKVITKPKIWCNTGIEVLVFKDSENDLELFEKYSSEPNVTYAVLLCGQHSLLVLRKGASILRYAESIIPSYPARKAIEEISLTKKGELPSDQYPHRWDELDWQVYHYMKNPSISYSKVGKKLEVSWQTVKNRFEGLLKDCKTWISFFPRGYANYSQTFLTFETEYETGLREELKKLDRTTVLYKFENTILINLFYDHSLQHYIFSKLEKKGLIRNLSVSIPVRYYEKDIPVL